MNQRDITEQAYKNGYAKGYEDGKRDAVNHGQWEKPDKFGMNHKFNNLGVVCSHCCSWSDNKRKFCPECGAKMDLPNITDQTAKALEKMGKKAHGEIDFDFGAED